MSSEYLTNTIRLGTSVVLEKPFHDPASYYTPAASSLATCSLYKSLQILVLTTRGPMVDEKARHELKIMADSHWRSPPPRKRTTTIAKPHKSKSTAKLELQHSEPRLLQCAACRFRQCLNGQYRLGVNQLTDKVPEHPSKSAVTTASCLPSVLQHLVPWVHP